MKIYLKYFFAILMGLCMMNAFAQNTVADVKSGVITQMHQDGYLSDKMAQEVSSKYISQKDSQTYITLSEEVKIQSTETNINWTQYITFFNFLKVLGVICILLFFSGVIKAIIKNTWFLIAQVPTILYQAIFLGATLFGTIYPEKVWQSQSFYIVLFCSFANLIVLGWIVNTYPKIQDLVAKIFKLGIPVSTVISFWIMIYFATLAIAYESTIFGFFAAIALSAIFSFTLMYSPGVLFLSFKENALGALIWGHIAVLVVYVTVYHFGLASSYIQYFNAGIQYYCSVALGVGLLVGASPFYKPSKAPLYGLLFVVIVGIASVLYFFLGMTALATTLFIFFALVFIEWVGYIGFSAGWVWGCGVLGGMLYGVALVMENYGGLIFHNLKSILG